MKNLFLNLYADIHKVSIKKAKVEIENHVASRMQKVFKDKGYSYQECKEAVDNTITNHIDEIFTYGDLNLSGETFDFTNLLYCLE